MCTVRVRCQVAFAWNSVLYESSPVAHSLTYSLCFRLLMRLKNFLLNDIKNLLSASFSSVTEVRWAVFLCEVVCLQETKHHLKHILLCAACCIEFIHLLKWTSEFRFTYYIFNNIFDCLSVCLCFVFNLDFSVYFWLFFRLGMVIYLLLVLFSIYNKFQITKTIANNNF